MALARRGHLVTIVDRDGGPGETGQWQRKGVMQFNLPHAFRPQVHAALAAELPDVFDAILAEGAIAVEVPFAPGLTSIQPPVDLRTRVPQVGRTGVDPGRAHRPCQRLRR